MTNSSPHLGFKDRVVIAFLAVPWLPVLIFVPYTPDSGSFRLFGWSNFSLYVGFCIALAIFTYLLEIVVLIPVWRLMLRSGKATLPKVITFAFLVALLSGLGFLSFISGTAFLYEKELRWLLPLICFVGCAEAFIFWLIVRPDKQKSLDGDQLPGSRVDDLL